MNFISALSCFGLLLAAAAAQAPKPCVVPHLMSGSFSLMDANGLYMSTGTLSYDAFGQRMRVRNFELVGNQTAFLDQLMLFEQGAECK
ncbi:Ependymin [Dissostichus eleginoides]|uniref:Ependymin n=1 Tax=Dissostichus eleginoides TaxID=100907 RepID=A0AAD9BQ21_DISEL|nr:Ependymin [Dissostichus eleginoides]